MTDIWTQEEMDAYEKIVEREVKKHPRVSKGMLVAVYASDMDDARFIGYGMVIEIAWMPDDMNYSVLVNLIGGCRLWVPATRLERVKFRKSQGYLRSV